MKLSEKIQTLRTAREWSQGELAERLEVSRQSVSKWETGQSVPDLDKILKLADLFGVTTDYLLREKEGPPPQPEPRIVYVERERPAEEPAEKKPLNGRDIICVVLMLTAAVTIFSFLVAGAIRDDEAALLLIFALMGFSVEVMLCRRHPWATVLWTAVGLLPIWIDLTVSGVDRGITYLMMVIGLTAAAFGLFLTYRKKN